MLDLPLELIDETLSHLPWPNGLYHLLFVNRRLGAIAQRALYSDVQTLSGRKTVLLLLSLLHASAPRRELVRSLQLDLTGNSVLPSLERLISRVLKLLPCLRTLSVELVPYGGRHRSNSWILPQDAPFHLCSLSTCLVIDPVMAAFLNSQPRICHLSLRGLPPSASNPFVLPPSALPCLKTFRSVSLGPDTLSEVITARPVQSVTLSLTPGHGCRALEVLVRSSTPVRRLTILVVDASAPSELFPKLSGLLPELEALHIVALVKEYNLDSLIESAPLLEAFSGLRFLTFIASGQSSHELEDEATVAERWARACPTLSTIILPKGRVWFAGASGRWEHS
ncbi:hypothetical protein BC834DRAFT_829462 [Gloeopeniophorella convolvens]|nr:hypothetical protein BC834DRAFT_829462 [Gloeopeniophorella convolvens]